MNEKYQLYYYWNHGMCDQCGAPILILNEALSYEGNDQQELQAFLDEHAECRYFSNKDEQKNFEEPTRVCDAPCAATHSASVISPPRSSCPGNGNGVPAAPRGWQACRLPH